MQPCVIQVYRQGASGKSKARWLTWMIVWENMKVVEISVNEWEICSSCERRRVFRKVNSHVCAIGNKMFFRICTAEQGVIFQIWRVFWDIFCCIWIDAATRSWMRWRIALFSEDHFFPATVEAYETTKQCSWGKMKKKNNLHFTVKCNSSNRQHK